jgi:hypothetical protein
VGFRHVPLDSAPSPVGGLVLGQGCEEAHGGPAFLVGLRGQLRPDRLEAGQPQLGEQQLDTCGVDRVGRGHAAISASASTTTTPIAASSS